MVKYQYVMRIEAQVRPFGAQSLNKDQDLPSADEIREALKTHLEMLCDYKSMAECGLLDVACEVWMIDINNKEEEEEKNK